MTKKLLNSTDPETYRESYNRSICNPESFWSDLARTELQWNDDFSIGYQGSLAAGDAEWFAGGRLNVCVNCIDRHVEAGLGEKVAYFYESDNGLQQRITYAELLSNVCRVANVLKKIGVTKGDRVCIYLPSQPEAIYTMLACTRIGAVHTVVFAGFSEEALKSRIDDCGCMLVVTVDSFIRGGKKITLFERVQKIINRCESLEKVLLVSTEDTQKHQEMNVIDYKTEIAVAHDTCEPEWMDAEDPLFILYTSGSTGKPKGVLHTTAGYLLYAAVTHKISFNLQVDDIYWSVADIGWITGHSYLVYGPLANGCTSVLFDGIPSYPDVSRHWQIIDRYGVTIYYTTPTIIRALMRAGDQYLKTSERNSLRILGTVGEPINPEAWHWLNEKVGKRNCTVVDTWWQTETGGHTLVPLPGVVTPKPGAAMLPFYGIAPKILNEQGIEITKPRVSGALVLSGAWPGHLRGLYNAPERFHQTYLDIYPGYYCTGDAAFKDEDGYLWVTGRIDDVLNIAGRLLGTAELESAIVTVEGTAEAAVVAGPDEIKGWCIHAFVLLKDGQVREVEEIIETIKRAVTKQIGSFAKPDFIHFVNALPKTRSGKIMRRILRKIVENQLNDMGDISTLAEPDAVSSLIEYWKENKSST